MTTPHQRRERLPVLRSTRVTNLHNDSSTTATCPIPATSQYLRQFIFDMAASKAHTKAKSVQYDLEITIANRESDVESNGFSSWVVSRSYREYRTFHKKLLQVLKRGHFCKAECPWLFSFLKCQFPKEIFFYSSRAGFVIHQRCRALQIWITTLHSALLQRRNFSCSILIDAVAMEFIQFFTAALPLDDEYRWENRNSNKRRTNSATLGPVIFASTPSVFTQEDEITLELLLHPCGLCSPIAGEDLLTPTFDDLEENEHASKCALLKLSCGHQFHDECIISRLNECMQCPTCGATQRSS